jgi:hypothetical protein
MYAPPRPAPRLTPDPRQAFSRLEAAFERLQRLHGRLRMAHSGRFHPQRPVAVPPVLQGELRAALAEYDSALARVMGGWEAPHPGTGGDSEAPPPPAACTPYPF